VGEADVGGAGGTDAGPTSPESPGEGPPRAEGDRAAAEGSLTPTPELIERWNRFRDERTSDYTQVIPVGDETVAIGGGGKRFLKRMTLRLIRPVVRRYDRLLADIAAMNAELARSLDVSQRTLAELVTQSRSIAAELRDVAVMAREHDVRIGRAATELDLLADRIDRGSAAAAPDVVGSTPSAPPSASQVLPDAFYWRFETALRGSPGSVTAKLLAYRELADELRRRHGDDPLWIDLGCGEGGFMDLLREWGWRVLGMDSSPQAVEACADRGLEATVGTLPDFLLRWEGDRPAALSLIQVIEHLPTATWLPTLRYAERILAPGGALVIETIDPRNPEALQAYFADVTHTWAAHPGTLEVMAGFAGFERTEVIGLNPGENGKPQDFALIARKA
jgi:SAM-dependent methyltransferase